jgi:hypothetical protein
LVLSRLEEHERKIVRSLLKSLKSGIKIVDQTFYRNPDPALFTKERTEEVVQTMRMAISLYENAFGDLDDSGGTH